MILFSDGDKKNTFIQSVATHPIPEVVLICSSKDATSGQWL